MFEVLLIGIAIPIAILVLMASARIKSEKSDSVKPDQCHPPKADTSHCKYDRSAQRRTSLVARPEVDLTNLPPKDQRVLAAFSQVNRDRIVENLKKLTGELPVTVTRNGQKVTGTITSRSSHSKELYDLAMPFMEEQFQALGLTTDHHDYAKGHYNLVATLAGDGSSKKRIILGAHGDATAGATWKNEKTKGADDDGSGMVLLLEVARALSKMPPSKYDIDFCVFTNEEQGLEGSYAYSDKVRNEGENLVLMIQFDMVAYHATEGNRMDVHDGENKNGAHKYYEDVLRACHQYELDLTPFDTHNDEMNRRSDHAGFLDHGYAALMFSEEFTDTAFNPNYHSMQDTVDKLNIPYYMEIIKLAIASVFNIAEIK